MPITFEEIREVDEELTPAEPVTAAGKGVGAQNDGPGGCSPHSLRAAGGSLYRRLSDGAKRSPPVPLRFSNVGTHCRSTDSLLKEAAMRQLALPAIPELTTPGSPHLADEAPRAKEEVAEEEEDDDCPLPDLHPRTFTR